MTSYSWTRSVLIIEEVFANTIHREGNYFVVPAPSKVTYKDNFPTDDVHPILKQLNKETQ